VSIDCVSDKV